MPAIRNITPSLWFDAQGEDAANFYVSIFDNSKILNIARYTDEGFEIHHRPAGSVMTVDFELDGHPFTALNGGPELKFNEAISFQIMCETQDVIDYYWDEYGGYSYSYLAPLPDGFEASGLLDWYVSDAGDLQVGASYSEWWYDAYYGEYGLQGSGLSLGGAAQLDDSGNLVITSPWGDAAIWYRQ
jgi:predicted 3-demethylubiquinone-9 3-methyltransferase (glyoxalase superfamily)